MNNNTSLSIFLSAVLFLTAFSAFGKTAPSKLKPVEKEQPPSQTNFEIPEPGAGDSSESILGLVPEHIERQNVQERLQAFGEDLLGDSLDINTGVVNFSNTDVSIPGNFPLGVNFTRTRGSTYIVGNSDPAIRYDSVPRGTNHHLADWQLNLPRITWINPIPMTSTGMPTVPSVRTRDFCTTTFTNVIPVITTGTNGVSISDQWFTHHDLSNGMELSIPGAGSQKLLDTPKGLGWPVGVKKVTKDYYTAKCISANTLLNAYRQTMVQKACSLQALMAQNTSLIGFITHQQPL